MKKCEHCDKSFPTKQGLAVHAARKHKSLAPATNGVALTAVLKRHSEDAVITSIAQQQQAAPKRSFALRCCPNCACPLDGLVAAMELANEQA